MKTAVIFDFGGVLMKTRDYGPRHAWDDRLHLPYGSVEQIVHGSQSWRLAQTGALPVAAYWQDVAAQLKLSADELAQLQVDYFAGDVLDQDLIALIKDLRTHGHPVGLLSNDSPELLPKLDRLGIVDLFEPLVVSARIGVMKPDPQAYQAVLDALALPAAQTVFVDDLPANIAGAEAVGMRGILYTPALDLAAVLKSSFGIPAVP